jgi:hypothetical protein
MADAPLALLNDLVRQIEAAGGETNLSAPYYDGPLCLTAVIRKGKETYEVSKSDKSLRTAPSSPLPPPAAEASHFGNWLRQQIETLGMKKQDAASEIGVAAVTLRSWFGQAVPKMATHNRVQLARLLKVSVAEIENRLGDADRGRPRRA